MNMKQSCKALICAIEGELDGRHCTEEQAAAILDHALPSLTEALARVEAERDSAQLSVEPWKEQYQSVVDCGNEIMAERDAAQAQLAEAVGLLREIETAKIIFNAEKFELNRRLVAVLARHAQAEQQEAQPARVVMDEWMAEQEAQGAQAVDERAAFEGWFTEKAKTLPLLRGESVLRYHDGQGQYVSDWALFGHMVWKARAALATQPAVRGPEHDQ